MLAEFFASLKQAAKESAPPVIVPDGFPRGQFLLRTPDGSYRQGVAPDAPGDATVHDIQSLLAVTLREDVDENAAVWVSYKGLIGVACCDRATLKLTLSEPFEQLLQLQKTATPWTQAQFRLALRTKFDRCQDKCSTLAGIIERVRWKTGQTTEATVAQGRASLAKSIEQDVTGTGTIPDAFTLHVPIFRGRFPMLRADIRCALEVDASTCTFTVVPMPNQLEAALEWAEEELQKMVLSQVSEVSEGIFDTVESAEAAANHLLVVRGTP